MSGESLENITKSDGNFPPTFVDNHLLQTWILMESV